MMILHISIIIDSYLKNSGEHNENEKKLIKQKIQFLFKLLINTIKILQYHVKKTLS